MTGKENQLEQQRKEPDLMEDVRVTVETESGENVECRILTIFTVTEEQDYIALIPVDENDEDNPDGTVYLYRYYEDADGNPSIDNIETDEEYDMVSEVFAELPEEL